MVKIVKKIHELLEESPGARNLDWSIAYNPTNNEYYIRIGYADLDLDTPDKKEDKS